MLLALVGVFALLTFVGITVYRQGAANIESSRWVQHTHEVLGELSATMSAAQDVWGSSRGYIITGREAYLLPFDEAKQEIPGHIRNLRRLTADNAEQQARLNKLESLLNARIEISERHIATYRAEGPVAAEQEVSRGEGKQVMDGIRELIAEMEAMERRHLIQRTSELRAHNERTLQIFLLLTVALGGLLFLGAYLVRRDAQVKQRRLDLIEQARAHAANIVDTVREPLLVLDRELRVLSANRSFHNTFHTTPADTEGKLLYEYGNGEWNIPELRKLLTEVLPQHSSIDDFEVKQYFPELGRRTIILNARKMFRVGNNTDTILLAFEDITERKRVVEAIRQAEREARRALSLLDATRDGVFIFDPNSLRFYYVNQGAIEQVGYTQEELLQMTPLDIKPEFDERRFRQMLTPLLDGKVASHHFETVHRRKDGRDVPVEIILQYVAADERSKYLVAMVRDITERKQAEEERERLFTLSRDMIGIAGFDGYFKHVNPAWEKTLGFTRQELLATPYLDFVHPDDREATIAEASRLADGQDTIAFENRYRCKDGSYKWMLWSAAPSPSHELIYCVARDITERKQAETELRHSRDELQNRFEAAVRASGQLLYEWNVRTDVVSYGHTEALGYTPADMGNGLAGWEGLVHPEDRQAFHREVQRSLQTKMPFHMEYRCRRKDGEYVHVEDNGFHTFSDDGSLAGMTGFVADISKRKELEQQFRQAQKMEAVGRLAGGVAHDFNNLLNVMIGYSELLSERIQGDEKALGWAAEIHRAGQRAASLTRQLLAFSRRQVLEPRVLNLNSVLRDVSKMLHRLIGEDMRLVTALASDLGQVKVDPGQMEQIILNLVVNARDAMPLGGTVTIETANVYLDEGYAQAHIAVAPGPHMMLAVSDTGCGMDAATRDRIFEPFFTTKKAGTGLGLATVYGIVKQSGGNIWVYSEPGKGTTFKIYLPRVEAAVEAAPAPAEVLRGTETVLLVEDSEPLRELARLFLQSAGYSVLEAADGHAAVRLAEQNGHLIRLLLTDVVMPGMSGRELAEKVKARYSQVRVLYMSGYTDDAILQHGVLDEGVALISKPFTREALARKVREVLDAPA